jgi:hypothetical protein
LLAGQPHIGKQLGFMDGQDSFNALYLNDDLFIHDQVQAVATIQLDAFVFHGQVDLTPKTDPAQVKFVTQALFVRRFQESRAEVTMNFNGCTDDGTSASVLFALVFSVSEPALSEVEGCLCGEKVHFRFLAAS